MLAVLDSLLRFAAVGVILLGVVLIARGAGRSAAGWSTMAFAVSVAAYLVYSSPAASPSLGALDLPMRFLAVAGPALLWLAALAMFVDGFKPRAMHAVPLLVLEGLSFAAWARDGDPGALFAYGHQAAVVALYVAAVWQAWKGYPGDLVEARRRFRLWFVLCAAGIGVVIAGAELALLGEAVPASLELLKVLAIAALSVVLVAWSAEVKPAWFAAFSAAPRPLSAAGEVPAADARLLAMLRRAMDEEKVYRREGLTIAGLAAHVAVPEHVLRKLINQRLGYRNFSAFLNEHRIEDVRRGLADPARARLPVLTLALEAGYGSVGPFNRAFKDALGVTPTEYRDALRLAESGNMSPIPESSARDRT